MRWHVCALGTTGKSQNTLLGSNSARLFLMTLHTTGHLPIFSIATQPSPPEDEAGKTEVRAHLDLLCGLRAVTICLLCSTCREHRALTVAPLASRPHSRAVA